MKRKMSLLVVLLLAGMLIAAPVFGQETTDPLAEFGITEGFVSFAEEISGALPFNTMIGLQWSDAHIGQLMSVPPKFGIGTAVGFTTIPLSALESATEAFTGFSGSENIDLSELQILGT
ncbi:MAG: hypothetical protein ACOC0D_04170, partial [Spirochaeta sp.]